MDKLLLFPGRSDQGVFNYLIDAEKSYLEKHACEYNPTIAAYINSAKPIKGKTQILLTALGAYEYWSYNSNGDAFPETALAYSGPEYGHKTFEEHAKIYKYHVNKDPAAAFGDVILSVYNPRYHRVELIVSLDNERAPDIRRRIEDGEDVEWSMGAKVPFDVCSICGNKAPTRKQYCEHLKYYMGRIYPPANKAAFAINTMPKFFDISYVIIGADKTAKTLLKVAKKNTAIFPSSAWLAEKMAENDKSAAIEKEVPANEPPSSYETLKDLARGIAEVKSYEQPLPTETLNYLGSQPVPKVMSTLAMLGILPKPREFQRIVLVHLGHKDAADELDRDNLCFDPMSGEDPSPNHEAALDISHRNYDGMLARKLFPFMEARSYMAPHLDKRIEIIIKRAEDAKYASDDLPTFIKVGKEDQDRRKPIGVIPMLALAASLYAVFAKKAPTEALRGLDKVIASNPGLAAALGLGLYATFNPVVKPGVKGNFIDHGHVNPDRTDIFSRMESQRQKPYMKIASLGAASKRLLLGVPLAYMGSGVLQKQREINPYAEEGRIRRFIRQYPDVVSGALIVDAVASASGRGTVGLARKFGPKVKTYLSKGLNTLKSTTATPFAKAASASEFVSNALIWPLAVGTANLPGRVVSGLFDQAVMDVSQRLLEKRTKKNSQGNI